METKEKLAEVIDLTPQAGALVPKMLTTLPVAVEGAQHSSFVNVSTTVPKALALKLALVMGEVSRIPKKGYNDYHKYHYVLESDVLDSVREALVKHRVVILPTLLSSRRHGDLTEVDLQFTIIDGDSGDTYASMFTGSGSDKGDKGVYKAYTGAYKYYLMKLFMIPTGDDPEREDQTDERPAKKGKPAPKAKPEPPPPAPEPTSGESEAAKAIRDLVKKEWAGKGLSVRQMQEKLQSIIRTHAGVETAAEITDTSKLASVLLAITEEGRALGKG